MDIKIYFENNDFVVCEKPGGVVSQLSDKPNMLNMLKLQTGSEIYPVHRLDIDTTGLMVYAKNSAAAALLSDQIQNKRFRKKYIAMIDGIPEQTCGTMRDFLFFDRQKQKSFVVKKERKGVKEAVLDYMVIETGRDKSIVEITLHTGRTHQIRAQFASRKTPVSGDRRYGSKSSESIHLHSASLSFFDFNDNELKFHSEPEWRNSI